MNNMQRWHNTMNSLHFPPSAEEIETKKLCNQVHELYASYCELNQNSTQDDRKQAYAEIHDKVFALRKKQVK